MGWDYVQFRSVYELKRKTGLLKKQFPTNPKQIQFISLEDWKELPAKFFFNDKESLNFKKNPNPSLKKDFEDFLEGKVIFFNSKKIEISRGYDWITNPSSDYKYDISKHWTEVEDLSIEAGDIKFTWEKSRFSFIYTLIRYDYHFEKDCAELVFSEIESWINSNPINQGPNYKCSQEISLRTLNWTFALFYYKNSSALTEERFQKIIYFIYWQLKHDFGNINFSRKAVRNNHAITEVLMLYLGGLFFPFFPEAEVWKKKGKAWFEEEIEYQIYEDGTFLQFSHNYHRVLVQLLTWAFYLSSINGEQFSKRTYQKAQKTCQYLYECMNLENGNLPNYGANDGALFFKFNDKDYRDYRPQINALAYFFNQKHLFQSEDTREDVFWLTKNFSNDRLKQNIDFDQNEIAEFSEGGIYTLRGKKSFTFIHCGSYSDRPSHADNLHVDIWYKGQNILRDSGTYKYNTETEYINFFNGTKGHNTVTLGDYSQMKKGPRFIWLNWSKANYAKVFKEKEELIFEGEISAFWEVDKNAKHSRKVIQKKSKPHWIIEDEMIHNTKLPIKQYWNIHPDFLAQFKIRAKGEKGEVLHPEFQKGWYSSYYGIKEESTAILFETKGKKIVTTIELK